MHATSVARPFHHDGWVYEEKVDGYRMVAVKANGAVQLISRTGRDHTKRFQELATALAGLKAKTAADPLQQQHEARSHDTGSHSTPVANGCWSTWWAVQQPQIAGAPYTVRSAGCPSRTTQSPSVNRELSRIAADRPRQRNPQARVQPGFRSPHS